MSPIIRKVKKEDFESLKAVIDSNNLFPSELLDEMISDFFTNENTTDIWLTMEIEKEIIAVIYCVPERMTVGTFNLYLIAIHKNFQGRGFGAQIMTYLEELLQKSNNRILIAETSGLPDFEQTRKFYKKLNYQQEAIIREFYQKGEDKVIFWKKLN
ncbi:MAG: GNAT family N-acetyltransferase [Bacteroidales bacterium]|jgi:GNAT superfamily N-acetyltransferase|nr:GNAT family N-acetyltransferase [Bacteroidales bacterium]